MNIPSMLGSQTQCEGGARSYLLYLKTLQFRLDYLVFNTKQFTVQDLYLHPLIF